MSNVRLSNGSPTLERMEARPADHPKSTACRCLFGPPDREELKRELRAQIHAIESASSAAWDFDFANDEPLPSRRFQWEAVDSRDMPEFYSRQMHEDNVDLNGNRSSGAAERLNNESAEEKSQIPGQRKRAAGHAESSSQSKRSCSGSDEASRVEHTPRKSSPRDQT